MREQQVFYYNDPEEFNRLYEEWMRFHPRAREVEQLHVLSDETGPFRHQNKGIVTYIEESS